MNIKKLFSIVLISCISFPVYAQKKRTQLPKFISRSYLNLNVGYISTPLSAAQLEKDFQAESIEPSTNLGIRLVFLGYRFNKNLSAQVSYWKPASYMHYNNVNGDGKTHSVWVHHGTLTLRSSIPIKKRFSVYGEGGFGIVTRKGFKMNDEVAVKSGSHASIVLGGGLEYKINRKWDALIGTTYSTKVKKGNQPHTVFHSAGIRYNLQPLPEEKAAENAKANYFFPNHSLHFGYSTNALGYGVNDFFSKGPVPMFWGGRINISKGAFLRYQKNVFHTKKFFSLDVGASLGWWQGQNLKQNVFTISAYPVLRFSLLRTKPSDLYFHYSAAGPSFITKTMIEDKDSGKHFTFQDFMGIGVFAGTKRQLNVEILINHYSNGNIFSENAGLKIPLTFSLGYLF